MFTTGINLINLTSAINKLTIAKAARQNRFAMIGSGVIIRNLSKIFDFRYDMCKSEGLR